MDAPVIADSQSFADDVVPTRCIKCRRPARLCYCSSIPKVQNQTEVFILQHRRERFHPFNTARIVAQGLVKSRLFADHNQILARRIEATELSDRVGVLYPSVDARRFDELCPDERPEQLIVLDGTWHHAKSLMRDIPLLQEFPHYRLAPLTPGRYRIRREPNRHALSTIEATVAALKILEPNTQGFDRLLEVFSKMIDDQMCQSDQSHWRQNRRRRPGANNVPRAIGQNLDDLVAVYVEHDGGGSDRIRPNSSQPLVWVAERLADRERFRCVIDSAHQHTPQFLSHLRLSDTDFQATVSIDEFIERWQRFRRPTDQVAVYHPGTAQMIRRFGSPSAPVLILKAINRGVYGIKGELEGFLDARGFERTPADSSRAAQRLATTVAYLRFLSTV